MTAYSIEQQDNYIFVHKYDKKNNIVALYWWKAIKQGWFNFCISALRCILLITLILEYTHTVQTQTLKLTQCHSTEYTFLTQYLDRMFQHKSYTCHSNTLSIAMFEAEESTKTYMINVVTNTWTGYLYVIDCSLPRIKVPDSSLWYGVTTLYGIVLNI